MESVKQRTRLFRAGDESLGYAQGDRQVLVKTLSLFSEVADDAIFAKSSKVHRPCEGGRLPEHSRAAGTLTISESRSIKTLFGCLFSVQ